MGRLYVGNDRKGCPKMIRRKWVIYNRKSRQVISTIYSFRKDAIHDLERLNDYCGKRRYAMQVRKVDTEKKCMVSCYPKIELRQLSCQGEEVVRNG